MPVICDQSLISKTVGLLGRKRDRPWKTFSACGKRSVSVGMTVPSDRTLAMAPHPGNENALRGLGGELKCWTVKVEGMKKIHREAVHIFSLKEIL